MLLSGCERLRAVVGGLSPTDWWPTLEPRAAESLGTRCGAAVVRSHALDSFIYRIVKKTV